MSASSSAGSNGRARRWAHAKTHAHANASRSNPIQWHRSWPQCAANCLISLWPRSSFLSTFFQVFGRDLFSLSALFKDLLYAGSPPDVVLQSSHCLSLSLPLFLSLCTRLLDLLPRFLPHTSLFHSNFSPTIRILSWKNNVTCAASQKCVRACACERESNRGRQGRGM